VFTPVWEGVDKFVFLNAASSIVAKVDELMRLCDQPGAQLTAAQIDASRLLESVLHRALSDDSARKELDEQAAVN
jgi:hypothetical protein